MSETQRVAGVELVVKPAEERAEALRKIASLLETLRFGSIEIVVHEGRVVQSGTHDELAAQPGWYRSLWQAQTGERDADTLPELAIALAARPNGDALKPREAPQRV